MIGGQVGYTWTGLDRSTVCHRADPQKLTLTPAKSPLEKEKEAGEPRQKSRQVCLIQVMMMVGLILRLLVAEKSKRKTKTSSVRLPGDSVTCLTDFPFGPAGLRHDESVQTAHIRT